MRGPTEEARKEARRRFESGESLSGIARATGIDRKTLRSMKEREGWIPQVIPQVGSTDVQQIQAETRQNVISMTTRQVYEQVDQSGVIKQMAETLMLDLAADAQITNMLVAAGKQTIQDFLKGGIEAGVNQNRADVLKSIVSANKAIFELRRMMAGKMAGDASIDLGPKVDPNITVTIQRLPTSKDDYERSKTA